MNTTILREDNEVDFFYENYKTLESYFPLAEKKVTKKEGLISDIEYNKKHIEDILDRQFFIAKDSIYYAEHSTKPSELSPDSVDKLRYVYKSSQAELFRIRFFAQQTYDYHNFLLYTAGKQS